MKEALWKFIFEKSRNQYDSATRWSAIVILALIAFHLLIFSPYLEVDNRLKEVEKRSAVLSGIQATVKGLSDRLAGLSKTSNDSISDQLDQLYQNLRTDFRVISDLLKAILKAENTSLEIELTSSMWPEKASKPDYLQFDIRGASNLPELKPGALEARLFRLDEALAEQVRTVTSIDELARVLSPAIEKQIIVPRFEILNQYLNDEIKPQIQREALDIKRRLELAEKSETGEQRTWNEIRKTLDTIARNSEKLEFTNPQDKLWWLTSTGKQATLENVRIDVSKKLDLSAPFQPIISDLTKTAADQKQAETALNDELTRIKKSFERFIEQQAAFAKPIGGIALDIRSVAARFPLLIGVMIAVLCVWQAQRISSLVAAADSLKDHDEDNILKLWLANQFGMKKASAAILSFSGLVIVAWLWIAIAAWQLAQWREIATGQSFLLGGIGCAAAAGGLAFRFAKIISVCKTLKSMT